MGRILFTLLNAKQTGGLFNRVNIGFPNSFFEQIYEICSRKNYTITKDSEKIMTIKGFSGNEGFDEWKENVVSKEKIAANIKEDGILKQISDFPLASKTPIEAQQFLDNIQKQINGTL